MRHRGSQVAAGAKAALGEEGRGTAGGGSTLGGLRTPQRGGDAHAEQGMKKPGPDEPPGAHGAPGYFIPKVRCACPGLPLETMGAGG